MNLNRPNEEVQRLLTLLRIDAQRVFERVKYREPEYMQTFSMKRTREHFKDIFKNRYEDVKIIELKLCSEEVIVGLDQFFTKMDDMRWYLNHTEDMPGTVEVNVSQYITELESAHEMLQLYINAELGNNDGPSIEASL